MTSQDPGYAALTPTDVPDVAVSNTDDDDPAQPSLSISDVTVTEGDTGTVDADFTVRLSAASTQTVTVTATTANGTAETPADYNEKTQVLTFANGATTQTFTVAVHGDTLDEPNETFLVNLSGATNATIADVQGTGTITNDDTAVSLRKLDVFLQTASAGTWIGQDVYYPDEQIANENASADVPAVYMVRVENEGSATDNVRVRGRGDTPGWKVRYFSTINGTDTDISQSVKGYGKVFNGLTPEGGYVDIRVEVTPDGTVTLGQQKDVPVSATSEADSTISDRVLARTTQSSAPPPTPVPTFKPDALVRQISELEASYVSDNIYESATGVITQVKEQDASPSKSAVYAIKVQNDGNANDSFKINGPAEELLWAVQYFKSLDGEPNDDVTNETQSLDGWVTPTLRPGESYELRVSVGPTNPVPDGTVKTIAVTMTSVGDPSRSDTVEVETTKTDTVAELPLVTFTGSKRANAGGLDNSLHKLTLTANMTQNGLPLAGQELTFLFESNRGHNFGTEATPDIRNRAKILDTAVTPNVWQESVTYTTDTNGQVTLQVLSSDVVSQLRLVAIWTDAGQQKVVGGVKCEFAAAISRRGVPDPVDPNDPNWQANDTGWSVEIGNIEKPGDVCNGQVTMQFQDANENFQNVAGHSVRVRIAKINLSDGTEVYDLVEIGRYFKFFASNEESSTFTGTTGADGTLSFSLKGMDEVDGVEGVEFYAQDITQWSE